MPIRILLLLLISQVCLAQQNTVLIIADDVSQAYFGFNSNQDTATTPNLNSLAKQGIVFDKAWAYPVCSPTRSSIFTGRYGFRTGMGTVVAGPSTNQLSTTETSIASVLRNQISPAYNTACVGKWHLHSQMGNTNNPQIMGYQFYSGTFAGAITDYYNYNTVTNGTTGTSTTYSTTKIINDAIGWIDTLSNNNPFFLWLGFNAPHTPFHKPPDSLISVTLSGTVAHINANKSTYFKASIEALDTELGRLMQHLDNIGELDSTNFIFIGDNGSPGQVSQNPIANRSKGTIYDYGVHVPMFIYGPAVVNGGRVSNQMVSVVDLFATIADLSGVQNWNPTNTTLDSRSLMPIIKNQNTTIRNYIFSEQFGANATNDGKSIRNNDYHLLRFDSTLNEEFYKISTDTFETNNLLNASSLTSTDILNYHLLCDSLSNLIGTVSCLPLSNTKLIKESKQAFLSPNPSNGFFRINNLNKPATIKILNIEGRILKTINNYQIENIDIEYLAKGYYLIQIDNNTNLPLVKY